MLSKCRVLALWLLASFVMTNSAEMDCSKRLSSSSLRNCCAPPNFKFDSFQESCGKYIPNGIPRMTPCLLECLFNTANVLNGSQLNMENTIKMLQEILDTTKENIDIYAQSMQNCSQNAERLMTRMRNKTFGKEKCSMLPIFISICSSDNLFVHCPPSDWRSSKVCEEGRDFMIKCKCDEKQSVCIQM